MPLKRKQAHTVIWSDVFICLLERCSFIKAEGFTKKFLNRAQEKQNMFETLMSGLDQSPHTLPHRLEKYLSPQENEIVGNLSLLGMNKLRG